MAGYIGTKAVSLSTTAADVSGDATIDGTLTVGTGVDVTGTVTADGLTVDGSVLLNTSTYFGINSNTPQIRMLDLDSNISYTMLDASGGSFIVDVDANNATAGSYFAVKSDGSERMRIDPAGRVTMPYQPAFRAKFVSSSQSGAAGIWVFDSVETNVGSGYNSSNGRFTAPVAGRYLIMATAQHYGGTSTGGYVDVYQNGSLIRGMRMEWSNTVSFETRGVSGVFDVSAGDYFHVYNASGTASHLDHSSFSGYLIG